MSFWLSFFVSLAFTVVGELLRPKPRAGAPKPTSLGDYRTPTADETRAIPVAYGTVRVAGPNAVWWGDFEARPISRRVRTGLFSAQRVILGHQYWLGLQLALTWGVVDELIALEFEDRPVPLLNRTNSADLIRFRMDSPTFFSADNPANGLQGEVRFYPGTFSQTQNEYLAAQFGHGTIPAYRGICYAVFEKCYLSNNDSLPAVAWTIRRTPNTLALTGGRENIAGDANPACMIFEIMTNTFWGAGIPQGVIDTPSFVAAANTLHAEGMGLSMMVDTSGNADDLLAEILRHIDGVVFIDPETGRFTLRLARNDFVVADLPLVNETNVLADSFKFTRGSWDETKNTVKIKYIDRAQQFAERMVQHQNLANITSRGGQVDADDFDYLGLSNATAANAVAARVLKTVSSPLSRVECEVNLTLFGLRPGSAFRLSWPQLGIAQVVYRVVEVDYGTLESGTLRIRATEDVFSVAAVSFGNPPSDWVSPFALAAPAARQSAFEAPYAMLSPVSGDRYVATTASPTRDSDTAYTVWQDASGGAAFEQTTQTSFGFTPNGVLLAPLPNNTAATGGAIAIGAGYGLDLLRSPTAEDAASGGAVARIVSVAGEELIAYTGFTRTGTIGTLTGVTRGIYDTPPLAHPPGAVVWFVSDGMGATQDVPYVANGATSVRLLPFNQRDRLPLAAATTIPVSRIGRAARPYPPGGLSINGAYLPDVMTGACTVGWAARDRVAQGRPPIAQNAAGVGPEAGVTYTLRMFDENATLRRTYFGLAASSQTWDSELVDCLLTDTQPGGSVEALGVRDACVYYYALSESTGATTATDAQPTAPMPLSYLGATTLGQTAIRAGGTPSVAISNDGRIAGSVRPAELLAVATCSMAGWFFFGSWAATANTLCFVGAAGEAEAENYRLRVFVDATRRLVYAHEHGAGVDELVPASGMAPLLLSTNYHIAVTVDAPTRTVRFYVNGTLVDTRSYVTNASGGGAGSVRLLIGSDVSTGSNATALHGRVQDVLFTVDLLTAAEIAWLHNGGAGQRVVDVLGVAPRLNSRITVELESLRGGVPSPFVYRHEVRRPGQQSPVAPLVGGRDFFGGLPNHAQVGVPLSAQLQQSGVAGHAVWSLAPSVAGAAVSGAGLLTFNAPSAGVHFLNVRLVDHPSMTAVSRTFRVEAVSAAPATNAVLGVMPNGYAGVPYYAIAGTSLARPRDGWVLQRNSLTSAPWWSRVSGLPGGLSAASPDVVAGVPALAGGHIITVSGGPSGVGAAPLSSTLHIFPTPTNTVLNPHDRAAEAEIDFVNSTAPYHEVRTLAGQRGRARAINGMLVSAPPRYWEVTVGMLPSSAAFALGMGFSAASGVSGAANGRLGVLEGEGGYEIAREVSGGPLRAVLTGRPFVSVSVGVPTVVSGTVLRFASRDAGGSTRGLWIAVEGGAWLGGGNPENNTLPTIGGLTLPAGSFWGDFRPALFLSGECSATANFGNSTWAYPPPAGFSAIPYALPADGTTENGWDSETESRVTGLTLAPAERGAREESRNSLLTWGRSVRFVAAGSIDSPHSIRAIAPRSAGRWQFEAVLDSGRGALTGVALVPDNWPNQVTSENARPVPGVAPGSFGVRFATGAGATGDAQGEIRVGGLLLGAFARVVTDGVLTFACDFDLQTVAVYRAGVLVGTYSLPPSVRPWCICAFGGQSGGFALRTRALAHPQAGFGNWTMG